MSATVSTCTLLQLDAGQWQAIAHRLRLLADSAERSALLSVTLDLGTADPAAAAAHDWLDREPQTSDLCYWAQPRREEYRLGLGRAVLCTSAGPARFTALQASFNGIRQQWLHDAGDTDFEPRACLGFAFDDESADVLPNAQLGVPSVVLEKIGERLRASFTTPAREMDSAVGRWQSLLAAEGASLGSAAVGRLPDSTLARRAWRARVEAALRTIAEGEIDKLVLSRTLRLSLPGRMLCGALLRRLLHHHGESTIYAIGTSRGFFCGATPERLVALRNDEVHTDALAGTAWAGTSLAVEKNFREQRLVVESIRRALAPLCSTINVPETPEVMRLRDLQHLHTPIVGRTHPGVGLFDLLSRLHPTPAVGGWPRRAACDWLRRHDEQRPGWYAGGFGWIDRSGNGEVAVALRCGLLAAGCMELSAGAGIVTGSNADAEYEETDIKLQTMLAALRDEGEGGMLQTGTAG